MSAPPGVPQHRKRPARDTDLGWLERARCRTEDPELFYPDNSNVGVTKAAKRVCAMCPVREQCLLYSLQHNENHGIWGGYTDTERRKLRRRRPERAVS